MFSSGTMISEQNSYGLALLIRGHIEATAALGYLCNRIQAFLDGNIDFEAVIWNIAQTMMGAKHELFTSAPDPINVMTLIEKTDHYVSKQGLGPKGMVVDCYAWLSEFAHPNFNSNDGGIRLAGSGFEFRHGEQISESELNLLGYLDISALLFPTLFDDLGTKASQAFA